MGDSTAFGKYRLIAELGHGGMADVFLAAQAGPLGSGFSKLTVIKRLRSNLAEEPEFVAMLVDEARIAARLNHPNVVQTNEVGEVDGQYFIAMEYLDGQPFHRIQHRIMQRAKDGAPAPMTKEQQYVIVMDALAGLHHAHELVDYDGTSLNIVHRDITPHNIFVTYEGQVKVVDFGIAKAAGRASETRQGVVKGKVRYMAPEQAVGHDVDRRADVFAAAVILWEVATGRRMWKDMDDLKIVQALVTHEIPSSPREFDPTVPEEIDRICRRALANRREDRYATADEFRADLETYLAESGHLVEARRKLPGNLGELFKDKRQEIRGVIERQIAMIASKPSGEFAAVKAPVADGPSSATPLALSVRESSSRDVAPDEPPTTITEQKTSLYQPRRRGVRSALVLGAAAAVLCVVPLVLWKSGFGFAARAKAATVTSGTTEDVAIMLSSVPTNASVRIDDGPRKSLPLELRVHRENATTKHSLTFEAEGFVTRVESVDYSRDLTLAIDLVPAPGSAADKGSDRDKSKGRDDGDKRGSTPVAAWTPPPTAHGATTSTTATATAKTASAPAPAEPATPAATAAPAAPAASDRNAAKTGAQRLGIDKTDPWGQH